MNYTLNDMLIPAYNEILEHGFIKIPLHPIFLESLNYHIKNHLDFKIKCSKKQSILITSIIIQLYCEINHLNLINSKSHIISELSSMNIVIVENNITSSNFQFEISEL